MQFRLEVIRARPHRREQKKKRPLSPSLCVSSSPVASQSTSEPDADASGTQSCHPNIHIHSEFTSTRTYAFLRLLLSRVTNNGGSREYQVVVLGAGKRQHRQGLTLSQSLISCAARCGQPALAVRPYESNVFSETNFLLLAPFLC